MTDLNKNSTLANNPVSSITPVDNPPKENPSKYDEVLNQYSQSKPEEIISESKSNSWTENLPKPETESIPETPTETTPIVEPAPQPEITPEPESETFLKPQPEIEVTPEPEFLNKTPDQIKQEISQILDDTPVDSTSTIIPPVKPKTNIFQILFVLSLIIFLIVVSVVAFTYFKSQKNSSTIDDQSSTISDTPTPVSSATCTLNDKTYKVGEGFPSADGCNTCSCAENGSVACTEMACESTSSATPIITKSPTSSVVPKITPDKITLSFYQGYIKDQVYKDSPYLTSSFIKSLDQYKIDHADGLGADPVLFAQDVPASVITKVLNQDSTSATVILTENFSTKQEIKVQLVIVNGGWKINSATLNK